MELWQAIQEIQNWTVVSCIDNTLQKVYIVVWFKLLNFNLEK